MSSDIASSTAGRNDDGRAGTHPRDWLEDMLYGDPGDTLSFVEMYEERLDFLLGDASRGGTSRRHE